MGSIQRPDATLEDRWEKAGETLLLTGIQALVRLPLVRHQLDRAMGWNTAGYVSGYRGSPLGTYDQQLLKQAKRLAEANVVVRPALNEDLAATAVWGTQQIALYRREPTTASSASGTARGRASTAAAMRCGMPIPPAPRRRAACWRWRATTRPASRRPSPRAASTPSWMSRCRCSTRPASPRSSITG